MLTVLLLALLFFGTLMPGDLKRSAELAVSAPSSTSMLAHVVVFVGICFMLPHARFWRVMPWHVLGVGLGLALLTEGLQFFAVNRHPQWAGVMQDMAGASIGWVLGKRWGPAPSLLALRA